MARSGYFPRRDGKSRPFWRVFGREGGELCLGHFRCGMEAAGLFRSFEIEMHSPVCSGGKGDGATVSPFPTNFQWALQALRAGLFLIAPSRNGGHLVWVSERFSEITLYPEAEVIGQNLSVLYGSKTCPSVVSAANRAIVSGRHFQGELLCYRADGTTVWCQLTLASSAVEQEEDGPLIGVILDVSEQKAREEALRVLEIKRRGSFENAVEGIYQSTPEGRFLEVNRALARMYGYEDPEDLLAQVHDIQQQVYVDPRMRDRFKQDIERTDEVRGLEYQVRRRDGKIFWISESARAVRDSDGRLCYYEGFIQDITQRKEAEIALHRSQQKLVETSRQIAMAEMATGILHNLGNALNSITVSTTTALDLLRESKVSNVSRVAQMLNSHADDLGRFLTEDSKGQQIAAFLTQLGCHLQGEQLHLNAELAALRKSVEHASGILAIQQNYAKTSDPCEAVSVEGLVEDALQMNANALTRSKVEVVREYAAGLPVVVVPKHKLLQILMNLIRNALQACVVVDHGERRVTVSIRSARKRKWIEIEVRDTGVGMSATTLSHVFDHGFTTRKDGHGFGLHSGRVIAQELGGELSARSDGVGLGAAFLLTFPCQVAPNPGTGVSKAASVTEP